MDNQRLILFIVFSFSLLLLWEAWQDKNAPAPAAPTATSAPATGVPTPSEALKATAPPATPSTGFSKGPRAVVETDLYGTFYCSQAAYPVLKAQGGGRIISISMTLHYRGWPLMAHATAAKAGIDALTRTLALEWAADGITVNAIAPGPIPTEGASRAFQRPSDPGGADVPRLDQDLARQVPLGRLGTPEDIGNMALYLASPAASWITGAIFVVDGGAWLLR